MGPTSKATIHMLSLLLFGGACVSSKEHWCYDRPQCGPNAWSSLGSCNGRNQSPINIITKAAISDDSLGAINFSGYEDRKRPYVLKNTGHNRK
nr:PREDICTED: carbonic anhydrase 4-like [Anolis carolinensis]|eukprot:XP_016853028.1 PREDICTED: carbonic anhydrase 4-like [Anolis carolinensis]